MEQLEYKAFFEQCEKDDAVNIARYLMVSLISADTMVDMKTCEDSITELKTIIEALRIADISEGLREEMIKTAETGIRIGEDDRARFCEEMKERL